MNVSNQKLDFLLSSSPYQRMQLFDSLSFFKKFIYLFYFWLCCILAAAWAFSSCGERGLLFVAVHGLLIAVASLVAEHGL